MYFSNNSIGSVLWAEIDIIIDVSLCTYKCLKFCINVLKLCRLYMP